MRISLSHDHCMQGGADVFFFFFLRFTEPREYCSLYYYRLLSGLSFEEYKKKKKLHLKQNFYAHHYLHWKKKFYFTFKYHSFEEINFSVLHQIFYYYFLWFFGLL